MFNDLQPYLRLLCCLLLSAGMHGAMGFYVWGDAPAAARMAPAPVAVSLLTVAQDSPPLVPQAKAPRQPQEAVSRPAMPAARPSPPVAALAKQAALARPASPLPGKVRPEADRARPEVEPLAADTVCMVPQDVLAADASAQGGPGLPSTSTKAVAADGPSRTVASLRKAAAPVPAEGPELTEAVPNYRSNPLPEYPYLARKKHWEGIVWLLVDVSAEGKVDDLRVERSCGHSILDRAASRTVRRWEFSPAMRAGLPTASQVRIPVRFRLEDS